MWDNEPLCRNVELLCCDNLTTKLVVIEVGGYCLFIHSVNSHTVIHAPPSSHTY